VSISFLQSESDDNGSIPYSSQMNLWLPILDCAEIERDSHKKNNGIFLIEGNMQRCALYKKL
jgi:hypothetical protein